MLDLRELIVFPSEGRYIVVCGNLRLRACKDLGYKELPCKVLPDDTPVAKLREYATKDNVSFGENDMDIMENEWDKAELQDWGIEFAPEKERMNSRIVSTPYRMTTPCILSFPNMMRNMNYSSLFPVMRWTATGSVNGWICST